MSSARAAVACMGKGRLSHVLPGYHFEALDVYALMPKGRMRLPRVAACLEALRAALTELA
jgi:DNA-binding transcriptional LysR family regulator